MATFRQWQNWRRAGAGSKQTPAEKAIKTVHTEGEKEKK